MAWTMEMGVPQEDATEKCMLSQKQGHPAENIHLKWTGRFNLTISIWLNHESNIFAYLC